MGEIAHPVEDGVDQRYHVLTVNDDRGLLWGAQRDV